MRNRIAYIILIFILSTLLSCSRKLYLPNENLFLGIYTLGPEFQDSNKWTPQTTASIQEHVRFLDSLGNQGILLFAGRTMYQIGDMNLIGVMILKYEKGIDALKLIMKEDPAIKANIQEQQFHPYSMGVQHFYNLKTSKK